MNEGSHKGLDCRMRADGRRADDDKPALIARLSQQVPAKLNSPQEKKVASPPGLVQIRFLFSKTIPIHLHTLVFSVDPEERLPSRAHHGSH